MRVQLIISIIILLLLGNSVPGMILADDLEDTQYYNALNLYHQKYWKAARDSFQQFQKKYPKSKWIAGVYLRIADMSETPYEAIKSYQAVLELPGAGDEWVDDAKWGLASTYFTLGQYNKAVVLLKEVLSNQTSRKEHAQYLLGLSYLALKNHQLAQEIFKKLSEIKKNKYWQEDALVGLADAEFGLKNYNQTHLLYDRYLREFVDGKHVQHVLSQKSKLFAAQGLHEDATQIMHQLVTRYPDSFEAEKIKPKLLKESEIQKYTIQVGAFSKRIYADSLVKRLRKKGYNAYQLKARHQDDVFIQVRVGSYSSKEFAEKIGTKLKSKENLPYVILTYIKPEE